MIERPKPLPSFALCAMLVVISTTATAARQLLNEPFFPELRSAELAGSTVVWAEIGHPNGRPLLFAVGFPHAASTGAGTLSPFDEHLRRNNVRLIAIERTGATHRSSFDPSDTLDDYVDDVAELIAHLGIDRVSVMGYSAGGPGALAIAAQMPERVASVHLMAARGRYTAELAERTGEQEFFALLTADPLALAPFFAGGFPPPRFFLDPADIAFFDRNLGTDYVDFYFATAIAELDQNPEGLSASRAIGYQPWSFTLGDVLAPVFIYQGVEDQSILQQGYGQDTAAKVGGPATVRYYPNEGHLETHVRHFDQVVADMKHLGDRLIMCRPASGARPAQTRSVDISQVRQALTDGYHYGDCHWQ